LQAGWHFCPKCGQKNDEIKVPIAHLLEELVESIWHFDSKFWSTLIAIVTRPGRITADFLDGKRAKYVPPIRLYIFTAFIFFFVLSLVTEEAKEELAKKLKVEKTEQAGNIHFSFGKDAIQGEETDDDEENLSATDSLMDKKERLALAAAMAKVDGEANRGVSFRGVGKRSFLEAAPHQRRVLLADSLRHRLGIDKLLARKKDGGLIRMDQYERVLIGQGDTVLFRNLADSSLLVQRVNVQFGVPLDTATVDRLIHQTKADRDSVYSQYHITGWWQQFLLVRLAHFNEMTRDGSFLASGEFWHALIKALSAGMFILMPLVALFMYLLFRHQRKYYTEHLIHSVHLHTVAFLIVALFVFLPDLLGVPEGISNKLNVGGFLLLLLYPVLSISYVYKQSWWKVLVKSTLMVFGYGLFMVLFFFGLLAYGAFSL
jgi:hypothetical protein